MNILRPCLVHHEHPKYRVLEKLNGKHILYKSYAWIPKMVANMLSFHFLQNIGISSILYKLFLVDATY